MRKIVFLQCQFARHDNVGCLKYMKQLHNGEKSFGIYDKGAEQIAQLCCNYCLDEGEFISFRTGKLKEFGAEAIHLLDCVCACKNGILDKIKQTIADAGLPAIENTNY